MEVMCALYLDSCILMHNYAVHVGMCTFRKAIKKLSKLNDHVIIFCIGIVTREVQKTERHIFSVVNGRPNTIVRQQTESCKYG